MEGKRASGEFDTKDGNETLQVVQTDSGEILLVTCEAGQEREAAGLAYDDEVGDLSVDSDNGDGDGDNDDCCGNM